MQVQIVVSQNSKPVVNISTKTGKQYANQTVGVILPGEEYPISDRALVDMRDGNAVAIQPGRYTAEAQVENKGIDGFMFKVNYRTLTPIHQGQQQPAPARA